jgi:hypothetical protein
MKLNKMNNDGEPSCGPREHLLASKIRVQQRVDPHAPPRGPRRHFAGLHVVPYAWTLQRAISKRSAGWQEVRWSTIVTEWYGISFTMVDQTVGRCSK